MLRLPIDFKIKLQDILTYVGIHVTLYFKNNVKTY